MELIIGGGLSFVKWGFYLNYALRLLLFHCVGMVNITSPNIFYSHLNAPAVGTPPGPYAPSPPLFRPPSKMSIGSSFSLRASPMAHRPERVCAALQLGE
jgi:hypothetical protein